jgi:hypothetical protein
MQKKSAIRMQLLMVQAVAQNAGDLVAFALGHKETGGFLLLPAKDDGTPAFTGAEREVTAKGFVVLGLIALLATADGQPMITDEPCDGVSADRMQAAKRVYKDDLISRGVLKPGDTTTN